jgi:hypothetical protein
MRGACYSVRYRRAGGCWLGVVADGQTSCRVELTKPAGSINIPANVRWDRYLRAELRSPAPKGREDVRALSAPVWR